MPKLPNKRQVERRERDIQEAIKFNTLSGGVALGDSQIQGLLAGWTAQGTILSSYSIRWVLDDQHIGLVKLWMHVTGKDDLFVRYDYNGIKNLIGELQTCLNSLEIQAHMNRPVVSSSQDLARADVSPGVESPTDPIRALPPRGDSNEEAEDPQATLPQRRRADGIPEGS